MKNLQQLERTGIGYTAASVVGWIKTRITRKKTENSKSI
jgi:hypothetical protein